jgi:hypothetical protein
MRRTTARATTALIAVALMIGAATVLAFSSAVQEVHAQGPPAKAQARCIRSRLKKKLRLVGLEEAPLSPLSQSHFCKAASENCNGPNSLPPLRTSDNLIHETKDFIELRGSPRPVKKTGGSLVGRGIANPMSERTRGFEMLLCPCEKGNSGVPLPALTFSNLLVSWLRVGFSSFSGNTPLFVGIWYGDRSPQERLGLLV